MRTKFDLAIKDCAEYQMAKHFFSTLSVRSLTGESLILDRILNSTPLIKDAIDELNYQHVNLSCTCSLVDTQIKIYATKVFASREAFLAFCEDHGIKEKPKLIKDGIVREGMAYTQMIHIIEKDDVHFNLAYTRKGLPSANCKVITNVTSTIACDVPNFNFPF